MQVWKPIAFVSSAALVLSIGVQIAAAGPCHDQRNMAQAVIDLKAAKASLEKAEHNKGGWRVKAIEAINLAIKETDRGCEFADDHH
jgi:hypothetical protein